MHEAFEDENEWDAVLDDLEELMSLEDELENVEEDPLTLSADELLLKFKSEPVFLTIGLSIDEGVQISVDGENEVLMIALLSSLFKGDLDEKILDQLPRYKAAFPTWGDETPMVYPDKTLWENVDEPE